MTRIALIPRLSSRTAAALIVVVAAGCSSGAKDAARTDTAAASAAGTSAPAPNETAPSGSAMTGDSAAAATSTAAGTMLDPNSATKDQLVAVSGMTPAAADALVAGRPYKTMVEVDQALAKSNLGADARKTVYAKLWKPIDLNTAAGAEILLIPGVGPRMRHEFEEYRPYKSMEQFRREIGKYVDKTEVARLEQYVTIK